MSGVTASRHVRKSPFVWLLATAGVLVLAVGLGCDDPLAQIASAGKAVAQSGTSAGGAAEWSDDKAGKAKSGGHSLGPGHAKRLYYQFIDAKGRVAFVERLTEVPAKWRPRVGFVEMDTPPPLSPAMAQRTRDQRYAKVADRYRQKTPIARPAPATIILYSADWCGWCKKAKKHLDRKGINYEIRDIDRPHYLEELVAKTGQKGIPVLDVGGRVVTGFSPDEYDQLIAARG